MNTKRHYRHTAHLPGILFDTDNFEHLLHIWPWVIRNVSILSHVHIADIITYLFENLFSLHTVKGGERLTLNRLKQSTVEYSRVLIKYPSMMQTCLKKTIFRIKISKPICINYFLTFGRKEKLKLFVETFFSDVFSRKSVCLSLLCLSVCLPVSLFFTINVCNLISIHIFKHFFLSKTFNTKSTSQIFS